MSDSAAILTKARGIAELAETIEREGHGYELSNWPGKTDAQRYYVARRKVRDGVGFLSAFDPEDLVRRVRREPPIPAPRPKPEPKTPETRVIGQRSVELEPLDAPYVPGYETPPELIPAHKTSARR